MNNAFEFFWKLLTLAAIFTLALYVDGLLPGKIAKLDARLSSIEKTMEVK